MTAFARTRHRRRALLGSRCRTPDGGLIVRAKQVVSGIVLAAMTFVVVAAAVGALWIALPVLTPSGAGPQVRDIPVIGTDSKIARPTPQLPASPRSGVIAPGAQYKAGAEVARVASAGHESAETRRAGSLASDSD